MTVLFVQSLRFTAPYTLEFIARILDSDALIVMGGTASKVIGDIVGAAFVLMNENVR